MFYIHFTGQTLIKKVLHFIPVEPCICTQCSNSASEALSSITLHLCVYMSVWPWRKQSSVRFLWHSLTSQFNVTPVTSHDPLRCWNIAAGTVNVTGNVGYCVAPIPSSYPLCFTQSSLRGSHHIIAIFCYSHVIFFFSVLYLRKLGN